MSAEDDGTDEAVMPSTVDETVVNPPLFVALEALEELEAVVDGWRNDTTFVPAGF